MRDPSSNLLKWKKVQNLKPGKFVFQYLPARSAFQQRSRPLVYKYMYLAWPCATVGVGYSQYGGYCLCVWFWSMNQRLAVREWKMEMTWEKEEWTETWEAEAEATRKDKNLHETFSPNQPLTWVMGVSYRRSPARHHRISMWLIQEVDRRRRRCGLA